MVSHSTTSFEQGSERQWRKGHQSIDAKKKPARDPQLSPSIISDNWPDRVPIAAVEIEVLETWFATVLQEFE